MFFGLDMEKILLIGVFAALIIGPQRLPGVAQALAKFVVRARTWANTAKARVKEEMGDGFDDVEWRKLDPRQYDPRRIVRDALLDNPTARPANVAAPSVAPAVPRPVRTEALAPRPKADPVIPAPAIDATPSAVAPAPTAARPAADDAPTPALP